MYKNFFKTIQPLFGLTRCHKCFLVSITCPAGAKLLDVPFEEIDKKLTVKEHNKAIARDLQLVITAWEMA